MKERIEEAWIASALHAWRDLGKVLNLIRSLEDDLGPLTRDVASIV
jgi:hypothetical protein